MFIKQTPFDKLAIINCHYGRLENQDLLTRIGLFAEELRIRYLDMLECAEIVSEIFNQLKQSENQGTHEVTDEEYLETSLRNHKPIIAYQDFIKSLNIYGRVLKNKYNVEIPELYKINFYRNKINEHWDDYLDKASANMTGYTAKKGKIVIPNHSGKANFPKEGKPLWEIIVNRLIALGVSTSLSWDDTINYEKYSLEIWKILEKIDPELKTIARQRGRIPEDLIEMLYDYELPVPFLDVESYSVMLAKLLEEEVRKLTTIEK